MTHTLLKVGVIMTLSYDLLPGLLKLGRTTEAFDQRLDRTATAAYFNFLSGYASTLCIPDL